MVAAELLLSDMKESDLHSVVSLKYIIVIASQTLAGQPHAHR